MTFSIYTHLNPFGGDILGQSCLRDGGDIIRLTSGQEAKAR